LFSSKIADAVIEGNDRFEEIIQAESDKEEPVAAAEEESEEDVPESIETKDESYDIDGISESEMNIEEEELR
jgi:hypothetical protein